MLTEREQAVKDILLEELGGKDLKGLSYVEHRHVQDRIDVPFLVKELEKLKKRARWMLVLSYSCAVVLLIFLAVILIAFPPSRGFASMINLIGVTTIMVSNYLQCRKRISIYRVLMALGQA